MPIFAAIPAALGAIGGGSALAGAANLALGVGGLVSANKGSKAATQATNTAANAQTQTATANNALQQSTYNDTKTTLAPYVQQGAGFNAPVNALLGGNPYKTSTGAQFETSPFYNFLQNEGMRNVNAGFGDAVHSGARQKALQDRSSMIAGNFQNQWFNQDQANLSNYNNAQGQYLNALTGQQDLGLRAAGGTANAGVNYANSVGNNNWQGANAVGNAALVNGQNTNSLMSGITGLAGQFLGGQGFGQPRQSSYGGPPAAPAQTGWSPPPNNNYLPSVY